MNLTTPNKKLFNINVRSLKFHYFVTVRVKEVIRIDFYHTGELEDGGLGASQFLGSTTREAGEEVAV